MPRILGFRLLIPIAVLSLCFAVGAAAQGTFPPCTGAAGACVALQQPPLIVMGSVPTGLRPLGIDILPLWTPSMATNMLPSAGIAVVANSGEDSVSILALQSLNSLQEIVVAPSGKIGGIPSPYAVAACPVSSGIGRLNALVTSPSDNSARVLGVSYPGYTGAAAVLGAVQVGPQPYSAACYQDAATSKLRGVVSSLGDSTLTVFDVDTRALIGTIPGVPGSRGYHGIGIFANGSAGSAAWVAGTDANVVTVADLSGFRVLSQTPIAHPTAVFSDFSGSPNVAGDGVVLTFPKSSISQVTSANTSIPNAQDAVYTLFPVLTPYSYSPFGLFATLGGRDSIWEPTGGGTILPRIPGAAALASWLSGFWPPSSTWCGYGRLCPQVPIAAVLVTSSGSNSVIVIEPQPATPFDLEISNAAASAYQQAPGSLASAFVRASVAGGTGVSQIAKPSPSAPPPTTLGGVTLSIGGTLSPSVSAPSGWAYSATGAIQAPLLFVGPDQINFQIPPQVAPGSSVAAQLTRPDGSTLLTTLNITATAPGIFTVLMNGQGQGAVQNVDYSQNGDPQSILGARPAPRGGIIIIYGTGAGDTVPALGPGEAAPLSGNPLVLTKVQPTVTIGGKNATVLFSGMAPGFVGLWQINAQVPADATPGNAVPLSITAAGVASNTVTIAVQ